MGGSATGGSAAGGSATGGSAAGGSASGGAATKQCPQCPDAMASLCTDPYLSCATDPDCGAALQTTFDNCNTAGSPCWSACSGSFKSSGALAAAPEACIIEAPASQ